MEQVAPFRIFVSILAYNNGPATLRTIQCLRAQSTPSTTVLVVDNGSDTPISEYLALRNFELQPTESIIRLNSNRGVGAGHNIALRAAMAADCEYVWLLEHDTFVRAECLASLILRFQQTNDSSELVLLPKLARNSYELELQLMGVSLPGEKDLRREKTSRIPLGGVWLTFNGLFTSVKLVRRLGPVREDLIVGFEDVDYYNRLLTIGGRVESVDGALAIHPNKGLGRYPEPQSAMRYYYSVRNQLWVHREALGHAPVAKAGRSTLGILRDLRAREWANSWSRLRGTVDGLLTSPSEPANGW